VEAGSVDGAPSYEPQHADELLVVHGFVRRPGPELRVVWLDGDPLAPERVSEILAA
jgi:hypothetical protein